MLDFLQLIKIFFQMTGLLTMPPIPKEKSSSSASSGNSSEGGSSSSKTPSPEHPSQLSEKNGIDATDFSVKAVIAQ